jgi:signal peptidase II
MRLLWISALVVGLDQLTKAAVVHLMVKHQSIPILGDWLKFTFTENPGMAFGIQFGPRGTVTVLSVAATLLVIYYMYQVRSGYLPYRASLAFILGGALGNIIDRVFYGLFLGYGDLFTGRVVDFIHVSLWEGFIPQMVPFIGGAYMELFPIWNVADMSIVLGVVGILYFQKTFHERLYDEQMATDAATADEEGTKSVRPPFAADASQATDEGAAEDATSDSAAHETSAPRRSASSDALSSSGEHSAVQPSNPDIPSDSSTR